MTTVTALPVAIRSFIARAHIAESLRWCRFSDNNCEFAMMSGRSQKGVHCTGYTDSENDFTVRKNTLNVYTVE